MTCGPVSFENCHVAIISTWDNKHEMDIYIYKFVTGFVIPSSGLHVPSK